MYTALVAIQLILAIAVIGLVLMQHGKGADAGAAFGSGSSGTVFGARGSANFLSRSTGVLATLFFLVSLALAVIVARGQGSDPSVVDSIPAAPTPEMPASVDPLPPADEQPAEVQERVDPAAGGAPE